MREAFPDQGESIARAVRKACLKTTLMGKMGVNDVTVNVGGYSLDNEPTDPVVILVDLLYEKPERTLEFRRKYAEYIGRAAKKVAETRTFEVFVRTFSPTNDACWIEEA